MSPINIADVLAATALAVIGNGLLGKYLLQRYRAGQEIEMARLKTELQGEIHTLQAVLNRTVFVHRTQFETEFAALRDIWAKVAGVRATMGLVRPMLNFVPADETPEQRQVREFERLGAFNVDLDALIRAVDTQSPFVPQDIYRKLDEAIQVARTESTEVQVERHDRDQNPMRDWYRRGREHFQQFQQAATEISDLIRARLETLTVVRGDR
jgi:hypothetical protein